MPKKSAGIVLYRFAEDTMQFLLVHPGGPFWAKKDMGAWSVPKGEFDEDEDPLQAAIREMKEETGFVARGDFIPLTPVKQKSGKIIYTWAAEADFDPALLKSNFFEMEWPPRSGKKQLIPEVDKAGWFTIEEARQKLVPGQVSIAEELYTLKHQ